MLKKTCLLAVILLLVATTAMAKPWPNPNEPSVAGIYNLHYGTSYDPASTEGLAALLSDHGSTAQTIWNTTNFGFLRVEAYDTSADTDLFVHYGENFGESLKLMDPGPWNGTTRGYLPGGSSYINLRDIIGQDKEFKLYVGNTLMDSSNTIMALPDHGKSFLIGYNGGGWSEDEDFNEPLLHMAETPIPAAVWLLGSGLVGLLGLRRKSA